MRVGAALCMILVLSACAAETQDRIARNAATSTVNRVMLARYPNLPLEPAIDCTIENASAKQIYALAADSVTGPTASSTEIVTEVVQRPETVRCLATEYAREAGAI